MALAFRRAVDGFGRDHVERFLASITSTAERPDAGQLGSQLAAARTDRSALAGLLSQHGLSAHADRLAFEHAELGLQILPAADGDARSRLGGPALLPQGESWPTLRPGRPLSFLAALDLAEVRAAGGDERLPGEGWLLFFADLDNDDYGLVDFASNEEGMPARVLFVARGSVARRGPRARGADRPRRVCPQPAAGRVRRLPDDEPGLRGSPTGSASTSTRRSPGMRCWRSSRRAGRLPIGPCPRRPNSMICCGPPRWKPAARRTGSRTDWTQDVDGA